MITLSSLTSNLRNVIEDYEDSSQDVFTYSTSSVFTLSETNATAVTSVTINSIETENYSYSLATQKVTIADTMSTGDTIEISFSYYNKYSDTELQHYLKSAILNISTRNYADYELLGDDLNILPEPDLDQCNLIIMVASILVNPPRKQLRLPDITISYADTLSKDELIDRTISIFKNKGHGVFSLT